MAIQKFEGTEFLVTYDEDLMDAGATRVWHFDHEGVHDFQGSYEAFAEEPAATRSASAP